MRPPCRLHRRRLPRRRATGRDEKRVSQRFRTVWRYAVQLERCMFFDPGVRKHGYRKYDYQGDSSNCTVVEFGIYHFMSVFSRWALIAPVLLAVFWLTVTSLSVPQCVSCLHAALWVAVPAPAASCGRSDPTVVCAGAARWLVLSLSVGGASPEAK